MSTTVKGTATNERVRSRRQSSLDESTIQYLEKRLEQRPDKQELQGRNILKEDNVAPALQAAKERLQRSQLEDKLDHALQQRPKPEELVKEGILKEDEAPGV
ncbi:hypothetical protein HETIRDRAFT_427857 [Heterobasidion irregulare TC 32-1]|uniref:RPEL repeat protein n=1 Tax=Heterobasidion irregulare (strain TC 32-1) TaxID=747525 RepID=W4K7J1_HETIT|nr:uncharacterized protein HETIRDRAFT_427857 [Heterobasidion irregulare TC 32-1]ETW81041.1 hypothetical protein HETIRDRAFT_427857 [Heterobasidion irregulare TC 32-1]